MLTYKNNFIHLWWACRIINVDYENSSFKIDNRCFVPWKYDEWHFLINDIKSYLKPNGIAIINPPKYFKEFENLKDLKLTMNFLKKYQTSKYYKDFTANINDFYIIIEK